MTRMFVIMMFGMFRKTIFLCKGLHHTYRAQKDDCHYEHVYEPWWLYF